MAKYKIKADRGSAIRCFDRPRPRTERIYSLYEEGSPVIRRVQCAFGGFVDWPLFTFAARRSEAADYFARRYGIPRDEM